MIVFNMFNISIYLEKFQKINSTNSSLKDFIISSIEAVIKIKINKNNIEIIKNRVLFKVNPIVKNEIFINKVKITKELKLKNLIIKDIF